MKNLWKILVLCIAFVLVGVGSAVIQEAVVQEYTIQADNLENPQEAIVNDFIFNVTHSVESAVHEIAAIPDNELFFYLGRPFIPFINWYWFLAVNLLFVAVFLAVAVLVSTLFPHNVRLVGQAISTDIGPVLVRGFLAAVLMVPAMVFMAITIIGIPLIILLFGVAGILGYTAIAHIVGAKVLGDANPIVALMLGALIVGLLTMIPVLGWLLALVLFIVALGAVLTTRFGTFSPRIENRVENFS